MSNIRQRAVNAVRGDATDQVTALEHQVAALERRVGVLADGLEESRRLNERLSDVLDVVTELLVPAVGRDDARLKQGLTNLGDLI